MRGDRLAAPRARSWLALVADTAFLVSCIFVVYTALGGAVRWKTPLFRMTLTEPNRPVEICLAILLVKTILGLDRGLFAILASTRIPIVRHLAAWLRACDVHLQALFVAYRVPLLVSATSLLVSLGLLELYLRFLPHTLPSALANHVASRYHTGPSGIFDHAPALRMWLMRPNDQRTMYFNGYRWHHKTDSRGFRNPAERLTADVVLLGDSIVYGHGVEESSTIRHHLETMLGGPVANLGVQGSSIHEEYQVLKNFAVALRPRHVFLFFLGNDLDDLRKLSEPELATFLETAVTDHETPYVHSRTPRTRWWPGRASRAIEARVDDLSVVKAFRFLRGAIRTRVSPLAEASGGEWKALLPRPGGAASTLEMRFHLHALRKMQSLGRQHGFLFVNVFTYTGQIPHEGAYERVQEAFCRSHGIAFLSLRPAFEQAVRNGEEVFLPHDGHLSDAGARLAARLLTQYVERHPAPGPER